MDEEDRNREKQIVRLSILCARVGGRQRQSQVMSVPSSPGLFFRLRFYFIYLFSFKFYKCNIMLLRVFTFPKLNTPRRDPPQPQYSILGSPMCLQPQKNLPQHPRDPSLTDFLLKPKPNSQAERS